MENNTERALEACASEKLQALREQCAAAVATLNPTLEDLANSIASALVPAIEAAKRVYDEISATLAPFILVDYEWEKAQLWAYANRPEWLRIYNRTKKRRTRKKYYDKIVREYRKEHPCL